MDKLLLRVVQNLFSRMNAKKTWFSLPLASSTISTILDSYNSERCDDNNILSSSISNSCTGTVPNINPTCRRNPCHRLRSSRAWSSKMWQYGPYLYNTRIKYFKLILWSSYIHFGLLGERPDDVTDDVDDFVGQNSTKFPHSSSDGSNYAGKGGSINRNIEE